MMSILSGYSRHSLGICAGGLLLTLTACATVQLGHDFDLRAFEAGVMTDVTTRADIRAWLGIPVSTGMTVHADGKRTEKWTYYYGHGRLPGLKDARLKMLEIQFNGQGQVDSYNWSE